MAIFVSGEDDPNPVLWLATQAGKMASFIVWSGLSSLAIFLSHGESDKNKISKHELTFISTFIKLVKSLRHGTN